MYITVKQAAEKWGIFDRRVRDLCANGKIVPALFCHDCRALLADTATEGYALLDLHDLDDIQAYAVEAGAEYTIRDYTVSIYKDKEADNLSVEVTGHLFETEKPIA